MPQRLAAVVGQAAQLDGELPANQLSAAARETLCGLLKAFPLHVSGTHPIAEAVITRGGVDVKAISPATMASRTKPGLFFCGEVVDLDAHTGGYNLQIAFSTGALAGLSAARQALAR